MGHNAHSRPVEPGSAPLIGFPGADVQWVTGVGSDSAQVFRRTDDHHVLYVSFRGAATNYVQLSGIALPGQATMSAADTATDTVTFTGAHNLLTGDGPYRLVEVGTLPGGLAEDTDYWVYKVDATKLKFCASYSDAMAKIKSQGHDIDSPRVIDLTAGYAGANTLEAQMPAVPSVTAEANTFTLIAGYENLVRAYSAPSVLTVKLQNVASIFQFWWE